MRSHADVCSFVQYTQLKHCFWIIWCILYASIFLRREYLSDIYVNVKYVPGALVRLDICHDIFALTFESLPLPIYSVGVTHYTTHRIIITTMACIPTIGVTTQTPDSTVDVFVIIGRTTTCRRG